MSGIDPEGRSLGHQRPAINPLELFVDGKIDAFLGFPPEPQEVRAQGSATSSSTARSIARGRNISAACWRATRTTSANHPVATKRVVRAILKAADLAPASRRAAARQLVDGGFTPRYDYALQTLNELPYDKWREYDAEDTIRFYALRLHELGMIKSTPQKIIADGTDWRFLDELKRELKA